MGKVSTMVIMATTTRVIMATTVVRPIDTITTITIPSGELIRNGIVSRGKMVFSILVLFHCTNDQVSTRATPRGTSRHLEHTPQMSRKIELLIKKVTTTTIVIAPLMRMLLRPCRDKQGSHERVLVILMPERDHLIYTTFRQLMALVNNARQELKSQTRMYNNKWMFCQL